MHSILEEIHIISLSTIIYALLIYFSAFLVNTLRWYFLIRDRARKNFFIQIPVYMAGVFGNVLTPGARVGGEVIKVFYMGKIFGGTKSENLGYILLDKLGNGFTFLLILLFTSSYILGQFLNYYLAAGILIVILAAVIFFIYRMYAYKSAKTKRVKFLYKIYNFPLMSFLKKKFNNREAFKDYVLGSISTTFYPIKTARIRDILMILLFSLFSWMMICFSNWMIYRDLNPGISYVSVFIIVTLSTVVSDISFTPGGAGFMESAMLILSTSVGISPDIATSAILINRGIFYIVSIGLSGLFSVPLIILYGKEKKEISLRQSQTP